jgi:hypothetical protein
MYSKIYNYKKTNVFEIQTLYLIFLPLKKIYNKLLDRIKQIISNT